jgi:hypothetical protein
MKTKFLDNMVHIGNILMSRKNKPIVKLYQKGDAFFILDVVICTNFREYYAYQISKENLLKFLENERNEYLLPSKNQLLYRVHFFDFEIKEVLKYKKSFNDSLSFCDEDFECHDIEKIKRHLNINIDNYETKGN